MRQDGKSSASPADYPPVRWNVFEDREGSIWIGLNGGGLVRWLGYPYWESWTEAEGLSADSAWGFDRDDAGVLWSINDLGVNRFNEAAHRWEELKLTGLPAAQSTVVKPARDGSLWLGQVSGVYRIDRARQKVKKYGRESGIENAWVVSETFDPQGRLWLGTATGLYRTVSTDAGDSPVSLRFERENLPEERGPDFVLSSLVDRKGRLWIGTYGGLLRRGQASGRASRPVTDFCTTPSPIWRRPKTAPCGLLTGSRWGSLI